MPTDTPFASQAHLLDAPDLALLATLDSPVAIQTFLDQTPYNSSYTRYYSPRSVLRERRAHCFDGACFAAAALWRLGYAPLVLDMRAHNDDDHVIAVFKRHGCYGCVAKSNTTVLRYREPVYRTLRELVLSFFDFYYNLNGDKALRSYSRPVDLRAFNHLEWLRSDEALTPISDRLDAERHYPLVTEAQIAGFAKVEGDVYRAGLLGADVEGLYKPA